MAGGVDFFGDTFEIGLTTLDSRFGGGKDDKEVGLEYARARVQQFCDAAAAVSHRSPPPGRNAANGWFREGMLNDPDVRAAGRPQDFRLSGDNARLYILQHNFYNRIVAAFQQNPNHYASWDKTIQIVIDAAPIVSDIVSVVVDLFKILGANDDQASKKAQADLASDIKKLVEDVQKNDVVLKGSHANGWISVWVHNGARATIAEIDGIRWADDGAHNVALALRRTCEELLKLPTDNHKPWLRAEWQVRFEGIMRAAGKALY